MSFKCRQGQFLCLMNFDEPKIISRILRKVKVQNDLYEKIINLRGVLEIIYCEISV